MRNTVLVAVAVLASASCGDAPATPTETAFTVPAFSRAAQVFTAHADGDEEIPAVETRAQGQAVFRLTKDGALAYRLIVANIENVTQAHIHMAPAGSSGGVVAWLYPPAPPAALIAGRTDGVLAEGVITAADLVGALAGMDLDALVAVLMEPHARRLGIMIHEAGIGRALAADGR